MLRPGGFCAFSWASPIMDCHDLGEGEAPLLEFVRPYFDRKPFVERGVDPTYEFKRTYGDWVRAFARAGLVLEDLVEPQTAKGGTHWDWPQYRWQRTNVLPGTCIWKARKPGRPSSRSTSWRKKNLMFAGRSARRRMKYGYHSLPNGT